MAPAKFKHKVKKKKKTVSDGLPYFLNYSLPGAVFARRIELKLGDST